MPDTSAEFGTSPRGQMTQVAVYYISSRVIGTVADDSRHRKNKGANNETVTLV